MTATPDDEPVHYARQGPIATVTMNRPDYRNAQNSAMTYALDRAFYRAADDGEVKVVVLALSLIPVVGPLRQGGGREPVRPRVRGLSRDVPPLARAAQAGDRLGPRGLCGGRVDARLDL